LNAAFRDVYHMADHVVYGSDFAYTGAQRYLGANSSPYSIIYNGVDTQHFWFSAGGRPDGRLNVLAIGVHYIRHRLVPLIRAMPHVVRDFPHAKLIIVGPLVPGEGLYECSEESIRRVISEVGLPDVVFVPQYTQQEAPELYALGDVLVHLKHMDWTPNTVIEAMACGLPVVHAGNGGMNELVGGAGVSLNLPLDWNQVHTPDPVFLAERILEAHKRRQELGKMARQRAVERYDMQNWAEVHRQLFRSLLEE
jgi:glycosyltransferase involved in cell wall biosynthesis